MLKSHASTLANGTRALGDMVTLWTKLLLMVRGQSAYVDHMDMDIWDFQRASYGLTGYRSSGNAFSSTDRLASLSGQSIKSCLITCIRPAMLLFVSRQLGRVKRFIHLTKQILSLERVLVSICHAASPVLAFTRLAFSKAWTATLLFAGHHQYIDIQYVASGC